MRFVLAYLTQADGEVIAGDIARKLGVSTARVAALLKAMEKNGLVTRHASPADARRTVVEITPARGSLCTVAERFFVVLGGNIKAVLVHAGAFLPVTFGQRLPGRFPSGRAGSDNIQSYK